MFREPSTTPNRRRPAGHSSSSFCVLDPSGVLGFCAKALVSGWNMLLGPFCNIGGLLPLRARPSDFTWRCGLQVRVAEWHFALGLQYYDIGMAIRLRLNRLDKNAIFQAAFSPNDLGSEFVKSSGLGRTEALWSTRCGNMGSSKTLNEPRLAVVVAPLQANLQMLRQ